MTTRLPSIVALAVVLAMTGVAVVSAAASGPDRQRPAERWLPGAEPRRCGADDVPAESVAKLHDVEFAGIVPGRGLSPGDFAGGGMRIEVDPSLLLITDDPVGVVRRAAAHWELPGTYIRFQIVGPGQGGNLIHAENIRQAARATVGRPGWGADAKLDMVLDVPFSRGDDSLVAVVTHEMGHWLGFDHSFLGSTVMFPILTDRINWVDPDQAAKAIARYGEGSNALAEVRGRVTRAGAGLSGARVNLLGSNGRVAFGTFSDSQGNYHVPVFAGTYRMVVDPNDGPAVDGNFIGTYPGGPLDFVTVQAESPVVVDAGSLVTADLDVPAGGDVAFKITTAEPTTCSPGGGVQAVTIYYEGARIDEIAGVEALSDDVVITQVTNVGGVIEAFFDVRRDALPGPRTFALRKTNGSSCIVPGIVGIVAPLRIDAPTHALGREAGEPVVISWTDEVPRDAVAQFVVSVSQDGGRVWSEVGRTDPLRTSLEWRPDAELTTRALRVRVEAIDAIGAALAVDASIANVGLGDTARGGDAAPGGTEVRVITPNGGELLLAGESVRVAWTLERPDGIVAQSVEASVDDGRHWKTIGTPPPTARSILWIPESDGSDAVLVRVSVRTEAGDAFVDVSDASARIRVRPAIASVTVKPKGTQVVLRVRGVGFAPGATVRINGEPVSATVAVAPSGASLKLKGDPATLHLLPSGQTNRIVVAVGPIASAEATFVY